ncbi:hypothetical protein OG427_07190 [Streptomyces sp. NBC_00133]|uniref:hypothetical protein n=1 Tax=Streptomyces sp. NBC_00133 TaxID=2903624 RepID=UPI003249E973
MILSTRSCIARPTETGFTGVYVHWDGYPTHHLPLLLGAYQHKFAGDIEAMSRHLVDNVPVGWSGLRTDLLDGAPHPLHGDLVGHDPHPSWQLDDIITADGSPPQRMTVSERSTQELEWAYVLHPHGLEVIALGEYTRGPVVDWSTDPRTRFLDSPQLWAPTGPVPAIAPPRATQLPTTPAQPAASPASAARPSARR